MWSCSFCSYGNSQHLTNCQACGRVRRLAYPILIFGTKRLTITSFSQIIGRDQIKGLVERHIETVRPRHVRFYFDSGDGGSRWLLSNLSKSSPVKHNRKRVEQLQYVTIQDKDVIELGTATIKISITDAMIDEK